MSTAQTPARWILASGLFNAWIWAAVAWALCGGVGGWSTPWIGRLGGLCGWSACLLAPFGWVEIAFALWYRRLDDPSRAMPSLRRFAWAQIAMILLGGLPSFVCGLTLLRTTPPASGRSPASTGRTGPRHPAARP